MACRCAPALVVLRNEINSRWPNRDKASDGCCGDAAHAARKSDHNANASGYAHAHDFDEDLFSDAGDRPLWDTLRPILLADSRTKYVIYEARIMYPDGTNKPYTGINAHTHHLHLSIKTTATHDTRRWLPLALPEDDLTPEEHQWLSNLNHHVTHPEVGAIARLQKLEDAVFKGVPDHGMPAIRQAVMDVAYNVAGLDLPNRPSTIKKIMAKLGIG